MPGPRPPNQKEHGNRNERQGRRSAAPEPIRESAHKADGDRPRDSGRPEPKPEQRRGRRSADEQVADSHDRYGAPVNRHDQAKVEQ
jgi:hypothetical protein